MRLPFSMYIIILVREYLGGVDDNNKLSLLTLTALYLSQKRKTNILLKHYKNLSMRILFDTKERATLY